jgi:hypothetical protein
MVDGAKPTLRRGQIGKRIVEIVDAFKALTKELGFRPLDLERVGRGTVQMGPRELRLATIYLAWASRYQRRFLMRPHVVVEWIEDERRLDVGALPLLRGALNLWGTIRSDVGSWQARSQDPHLSPAATPLVAIVSAGVAGGDRA